MVLVADFTRSESLLLSFCFCGGAVLVGTADIDDINVTLAKISAVDVCTENGADDVAEMGIIIDVGKGACDENVARGMGGDRRRGVGAHDWF